MEVGRTPLCYIDAVNSSVDNLKSRSHRHRAAEAVSRYTFHIAHTLSVQFEIMAIFIAKSNAERFYATHRQIKPINSLGLSMFNPASCLQLLIYQMTSRSHAIET